MDRHSSGDGSDVFFTIVAGAHPRLINEELSHSSLDVVHIGLTKDSLSMSSSTSTMFAQCLVSMLSSACHRPNWPWFVKTLNQPQLLQHFPMRLRF